MIGVRMQLRSAYGRYYAIFGAVHFCTFYLVASLTSGIASPDLALGTWVLVVGSPWLLAAITLVPLIRVAFASMGQTVVHGPGAIAWRAAVGTALTVANLFAWSLLLGELETWLVPIRLAPIAAIVAVPVAAAAIVPVPITRGAVQWLAMALTTLALAGLLYHLVIPAVAPAFAYQRFGIGVQARVATRELRTTKVGDSAASLARRLPGFVSGFAVAGDSVTQVGLIGTLDYRIVFRDGRIAELETK